MWPIRGLSRRRQGFVGAGQRQPTTGGQHAQQQDRTKGANADDLESAHLAKPSASVATRAFRPWHLGLTELHVVSMAPTTISILGLLHCPSLVDGLPSALAFPSICFPFLVDPADPGTNPQVVPSPKDVADFQFRSPAFHADAQFPLRNVTSIPGVAPGVSASALSMSDLIGPAPKLLDSQPRRTIILVVGAVYDFQIGPPCLWVSSGVIVRLTGLFHRPPFVVSRHPYLG